MSFQFTSPNAAGAGNMEQMMIAMQKSMEKVQETESKIIQSSTTMAKAVSDSIEEQTSHEADQMKMQAIGQMVGGSTSIVSAGLEGVNLKSGLDNAATFDEAALNESYANSLEEGIPNEESTVQVETADGDQTEGAPADTADTAELQAEKAQKREEATTLSKNFVEKSDEGSLGKTETGEKKKQTQIDNEKKALKEASKEMDSETRDKHIKRFRAKAKALREEAANRSGIIQQRTQLNQTASQAASQGSQGAFGMASSSEKQDAGQAQAAAEVARQTNQGREKVEQTATTQRTEIGKALEQAAQSQRYYSQRG